MESTAYLDAFEQGYSRPDPTLCIDIDGVLAFFMEAAVTALNTKFGTEYIPYQSSYYFQSWLSKEQGEWIDTLFATPTFYSGIAPDYAGIAACNALTRSGKEIWVVTDRPEASAAVTSAWLDHWRVGRNVTIVGKGMKQAVSDNSTEPLVFVDDDPRKIKDLNLNGQHELFLIKRPWTPADIDQPDVHVFEHWVDLLLYFDIQPEVCDVPQLWRTPAVDTSDNS